MSLLKKDFRGCFLLQLLLAGNLFLFASCINTQKTTYFNDLKDASKFAGMPVPESLILPNDILGISVTSLSPEATVIFNNASTNNNSVNSTNGNNEHSGYFVNKDGTIHFPMLGSIKAAGLTTDQLKTSLTKSLIDKKLLIDPIITVRFQNFRVTVLGEVKNASVIPVPSEKISLLEAIGLAGDLTIYAKRDNVLVIREQNGEKVVKRLNLNSSELFTSPYYYLKANDVVYVEANKARVATSGRTQLWLPVLFSGLSLAAIIIDRIIK